MLKNFVVKEKNNPHLHIETADTFIKRFMGLMGRKDLPAGYGLLLSPCSSIHMCFMRFAIDAIYLDKNFKIIKIVRNLRPWIGISCCLSAYTVIEIKAGTADKYGCSIGVHLVEL